MPSTLPNITRNTDSGLNTASVTWTPPTPSDNSGMVDLDETHTPPVDFPIGVSVVSYTATDNSNNMRLLWFTVTVTGRQRSK